MKKQNSIFNHKHFRFSILHSQFLVVLLSLCVWLGAEGQISGTITITVYDDETGNLIAINPTSGKYDVCKGQRIKFVATANNINYNGNNVCPSGSLSTTIINKIQWFVNQNTGPSSTGLTSTFITSEFYNNPNSSITVAFSTTKICINSSGSATETTIGAFGNGIGINYKFGYNFGSISGDPILNTNPITNTSVSYKINPGNIPSNLLSQFTFLWSIDTNIGAIVGNNTNTSVLINTTNIKNQTGKLKISTIPIGCENRISSYHISEQQLTTRNTPPTKPESLAVTQAQNPNRVLVSWVASTDINGDNISYKVFYKEINSPNVPNFLDASNNLTSLEIPISPSSVVEGNGFIYFVTAYDDENEPSPTSDTRTFMFDVTPPPVPNRPSLTSQTTSKAVITWNSVTDNSGIPVTYDIYKDEVLLGSTQNNSYVITNNVPLAANYKINLKARDVKNNASDTSLRLTVSKIPAINIDESNGYIGIGVVPPLERLHVGGNLKIEDGSLIFKGTPPLGTHIKTDDNSDLKIGNNINFNADATDPNKPNRITYNGSALEFFSPSQAEHNDNKPVWSLSKFGEIKYESNQFLNYKSILFKGTGETQYNNGLRVGDNFGGTTGFDGPMLYGENGGILGTNKTKKNNEGTNVALKWDGDGRVGIGVAGALTEKLEVNGNVKITGNNVLEFGAGLTKEQSAGKIVYGVWDTGLCIVGGGTNTTNRRTRFINEGGAFFEGSITVPDSKPAETPLITIGDDTYLTDIDAANVLGVYGTTGNYAGIKLGSAGPTIYGGGNGILEIGNTLVLGSNSGESIVRNVSAGSLSLKTNYNERLTIANNGDTKITGTLMVGTAPPTGTNYKLGVDGNARVKGIVAAYEVVANASATPDYVFEKSYTLPSLEETKQYVEKNKHLPYIKSAKELEASGINMTEHTNGMLRHIEEMYLHIIRLENEIKELKAKKW